MKKRITLLFLITILLVPTEVILASENNVTEQDNTIIKSTDAPESTTNNESASNEHENDMELQSEGSESEQKIQQEVTEQKDFGDHSGSFEPDKQQEKEFESTEQEINKATTMSIQTLKYANGDEGDHVRDLKLKLRALGFGKFSSNPSIRYGDVTERVVKEFQVYYKLPETGVADEATRNKIDEVLNPPYVDGDRGQAIKQLKQKLTKLGYGKFPSNPSLNYGTVTANVVKEFQSDFGLSKTGIADQKTLDKIDEILSSPYKNGESGSHVRELKLKLSALGFGKFPSNPSINYGNVTSRVVKEFQSFYGLPATGVVDDATLVKINELYASSYRNGVEGEHIKELKQKLRELGFGKFPSNPSKKYGNVTERVVREFQSFYGLEATGIADQKTLDKLDEILSKPYADKVSGSHVVYLKKNLTRLGFGKFPSNPSGNYGSVTIGVVKEFQEYYNLPNKNGIADRTTIRKMNQILNSEYRNGQKGPHIKQLKLDLRKLGFGKFPSNPSENYGSVTERVVREFQEYHKLKVNGIADEVTLAKISELIKQLDRQPIIKTEHTDYKISFEQALDIQMEQLNLTDNYRNREAYVDNRYLRYIGDAKIKASTKVNIRSKATTNSTIVTQLKNGDSIRITGYVDDGESYKGSRTWYKINYKNRTSYVHSSFVQGNTAIATTRVNVRAGKGTTYSVLGHIGTSSQERVTIISHGTRWHQINPAWIRPTRSELAKYLNPDNNDKFQHLRLDTSLNVTASQLNKVLKDKGILDGKGSAFIKGASKHNINEAYLIAHALHETGNGSSALANGIEVGKNSKGQLVRVTESNRKSLTNIRTTYNMFGIGAVDSNANTAGAIKAYEEGWFTPEDAIIGGADWIGRDYIHNQHKQNTLYKMKWNPRMSEGYQWKQYATDIEWATKQIDRIKAIYDQLDNPSYHYDIASFK